MAQPLVVHEWGVNEFDWSGKASQQESLPGFIYTDKSPGKPLPVTGGKVKDMSPDSGMRKKPVLYFYPQGYMTENVKVGVEVRFAAGYANVWWPQVNFYRTPEQVAAAKPVDWQTWRKKQASRRYGKDRPKVPDDERFELVWYNLALTKKLPKGMSLAGPKLPKDHWVRLARQGGGCYVSNGREVEKFLFYEGKTRETPTVTILPPQHNDKRYHLVNVGDYPIYDVFVIYRDNGKLWMKYLAVMPPVPMAKKQESDWGHHVPQIVSLPMPDFSMLPSGMPMGKDEFNCRTSMRLIESLSAGEHYSGRWATGLRDPADPQPPTKMHQLFRAEAEALEKIWRKEFFLSPGLTILYRESPAYLDKAMPLNIYTDMQHYVKLSRCGLVLNRNVPFTAAKSAFEKIYSAINGKEDPKKTQAICSELRKHRLLSLGQAKYILKQRKCEPKRIEPIIKALEADSK